MLEDVLARVKQLDELAQACPNCKGPRHAAPVDLCYMPIEAQAAGHGVWWVDREYRSLLPRVARALEIAVDALQRHYDDGCTPLGPDLAAVEKALAPESSKE